MRVAVFGAAGRTGRLVAEMLAERGHDVVSVTRRPVDGLPGEARVLDATDRDAVRGLAAELDAVVNATASGPGNHAGSNLAAALAGAKDGLRYVTVGGAAVDAPDDRKSVLDRAVSWIARKTTGDVVLDRQRELDMLRAGRHGLAWTMLRPPRLTDKPGRGAYRLTTDHPASTQIARADLAAAVCDLLDGGERAGSAPFAAW